MSTNPRHQKSLDISVGDVYAHREGGGSVHIQEMCQSPVDRSLDDCGIGAGQFASPVVLLIDHDIDGSQNDVVAFHLTTLATACGSSNAR